MAVYVELVFGKICVHWLPQMLTDACRDIRRAIIIDH